MSKINENGSNDIVYRIAVESDRDNILDFMRKHYYPEEPITIGNAPKMQDSADEKFSVSLIPYGASIIAVDPLKNDKIVGVVLVGPIEEDEADLMREESKRCSSESKKWAEILLLLAHLEENANIYKRYNVKKALHIHVLGVDSEYIFKSILNLFHIFYLDYRKFKHYLTIN